MINWMREYADGFDSPWGLLQKLSWLNCTPAAVLLKAIGLVPPGMTLRAVSNLPCGSFDWLAHGTGTDSSAGLDHPATVQCFAADLRRCLAHNGLDKCDRPISLHNTLRLCPLCIEKGYHSVVHQLQGLARCPIDGMPLIDTCPKCGASLPRFTVGNIRTAFSCEHCKSTWLADAGALFRSVPWWRTRERETVGAVVKWVRELWPFEYRVQNALALQPGWRLCTSMEEAAAGIPYAAARVWMFHALHSFPLDLALLAPYPVGFSIRPLLRSELKRASGACSGYAGFSPKHIVDGVSRYLSQLVLKEHRGCIIDARYVLFRFHSEYEYHYSFHPYLCPVGYAFAIWQTRVYDYMRSLRRTCSFERREWFHVAPAQQAWLRLALLNSFLGTLHQVILMQITKQYGICEFEEVVAETLRTGYDPWVGPVFNGTDARIPLLEPGRMVVALEPGGLLKMAKCDHGRAREAHNQRLSEIAAKILP